MHLPVDDFVIVQIPDGTSNGTEPSLGVMLTTWSFLSDFLTNTSTGHERHHCVDARLGPENVPHGHTARMA